LFFLDESGFRLGSCGRYGWSEKGSKAFGYEIHGSWETMTMIGAMTPDEICSFMTIDLGMSREVFGAFVETYLLQHLRKGDCVLMDNLSVHKNNDITKKIELTGALVRYLPPYSPDLNPIKKLWAKLKESLRRLETTTRDAFDNAVTKALKNINVDDLRAWTIYCGYNIASS
jgi:transposase